MSSPRAQSRAALLSVGGVWRVGASPALLIQMRSSVRPAFSGERTRRSGEHGRADSTMTATDNTYDVIVVGGGISGR